MQRRAGQVRRTVRTIGYAGRAARKLLQKHTAGKPFPATLLRTDQFQLRQIFFPVPQKGQKHFGRLLDLPDSPTTDRYVSSGEALFLPLKRLDQFYDILFQVSGDGSQRICIRDTIIIQSSPEKMRDTVGQHKLQWRSGFAIQHEKRTINEASGLLYACILIRSGYFDCRTTNARHSSSALPSVAGVIGK